MAAMAASGLTTSVVVAILMALPSVTSADMEFSDSPPADYEGFALVSDDPPANYEPSAPEISDDPPSPEF